MRYNKPAKTPKEIIELLKSRKLIINDEDLALNYLSHVGHFRLAGYSLIFQEDKERHLFRLGTKFEDIIEVYEFDRKLRVLLFDALERIEVAFRTTLNIEMNKIYGAWWIVSKDCYHTEYYSRQDKYGKTEFEKLEETLKRKVYSSHDIFIKHFKRKYSENDLPPSWMLLEIMDFGNWSMIYDNLNYQNQAKLKHSFYSNTNVLPSWIQALSYLRNLCAHHSRVWNRVMTKKPLIPKSDKLFDDNTRVYSMILIILILLDRVKLGSDWKMKFQELLIGYPNIDKKLMGFPENWKEAKIWE